MASKDVPSEWTMMGTSSSSDFASAVLLLDCWGLCVYWEGEEKARSMSSGDETDSTTIKGSFEELIGLEL